MGIWGSIAKSLPVVGPIIGGVIEAATAKKAADQQVAGGQRAMDIQDRVYQQQQNLLQPYYNTGTAAFTTLGGLLGLPSGGGGGMPTMAPTNTLGSTMNAPISPGQANFSRYSPTGGYIGKDVPMAEQMKNPAVNLDASGYTAQQHGASSYGSPMLKVQAPNGNIYTVPADKAGEVQQNGGTVLGTA